MKRDKHDKVMSDLVRERADWRCERCNKYYPEGHRSGLENSHYYGRARMSTRYFPDNLTSLCTGCHFYFGGARDEYTSFLIKALGESRFDDLVLKGNAVRKFTRAEKEEQYQHYRAQYKYLRRRRDQGETGWIDFVSWD